MVAVEQKRGVKFDATINLGHMLTFCGFLACIGTAWNVLDKRVSVLEERSIQQSRRDDLQDIANKELRLEIRDALRDLRDSLERLGDKLEKRGKQ